jgi:outer membrane protein TolC
MLPRGDSLQLKQQQLTELSRQHPMQRQNRRTKLALEAGKVWLDAYQAQQSIALIEQNRALFEQLADVAQASYSSAVGKTRQHDIVRAQLELTRLEDRLTVLEQQQVKHARRLWQWLSGDFAEQYLPIGQAAVNRYRLDMPLATQLPNVRLLKPNLFDGNHTVNASVLVSHLSNHPAVKAVAQKIKATTTQIALAQQKYQPQWGLNASYGYRDDMPTGANRADLLSIGVSFDVPLYAEQKQDKEVEAAVAQAESVKTEKWLLLRRFIGAIHTLQGQLQRLEARRALYQTTLLPQMYAQAEAALTAYTNDDGDFAEVVRARIAELNAQIDALTIDVARQKIKLELNYYLVDDHNGDIVNTGAKL